MQISNHGEVLDERGRPISRLGLASWCLVLRANDVEIHIESAEQPTQPPEIVVVPRRSEILFTMLADTVQGELELCFALRGLPVDVDALVEVSSILGLVPLLNLNPMDLSGGQKAKLAVALALLVKPRVLVIDNTLEPVDRLARQVVIKVLRRAVIGGLRLVELATVGPTESEHIDEVVIATAASVLRFDSACMGPIKCWGESDFAGIPEPPIAAMEPTLILDSLSFRYRSGFGLSSVALNVYGGDIVWLTGPNGAGKTTLLKCLALLLSPQSGTMVLNEGRQTMQVSFPIGKRKPAIHQFLLYQFQEPDDQIYCATIYEELLSTVHHVGGRTGVTAEHVAKTVGLETRLDDSPWNLNRSSRRLLTLGSVICANPCIALLDDPTAELDSTERRRVALALREYIGEGGACIVVSHDEPFMRKMATKTLYLNNGTLVSQR